MAKKRKSNSSTKQQSQHNSRATRQEPVFDERLKSYVKQTRVDLIPRNLKQEEYIETMMDDSYDIVLAIGDAGTGKSMLATRYAVKCLMEGLVERIVITRPAVSVDEQHGFLPGTLVEKMAPWTRPIFDELREFYSPQKIAEMIEDEVIEIAPLAYMRGRTFKNCIIIADEIQNTTPSQMLMLTSRLGTGTKMIITGDVKQHDRGFEINGLADFRDRFTRFYSSRIKIVEFGKEHVERHPVVSDILDMYSDLDMK